MKPKATPPTSIPDLLTPVRQALKQLDHKGMREAAKACGVSRVTLIQIRDDAGGRFGPGYHMVRELYLHLVANKAPAAATAAA